MSDPKKRSVDEGTPTLDEVLRAACQHDHDWDFLYTNGSRDPVQLVCARCGRLCPVGEGREGSPTVTGVQAALAIWADRQTGTK